jgi:Flp pilus assembly protein TadB
MEIKQMSELNRSTNGKATEAHQDWPNLIRQAVDDLSRILHSEAEILQTRVGDSIRSGLNRSAEGVALLAIFLWSIGCLLLGVILFLHLWLPLWFAFGVVGLCTISVAILGTLTMQRRSRSATSDAPVE